MGWLSGRLIGAVAVAGALGAAIWAFTRPPPAPAPAPAPPPREAAAPREAPRPSPDQPASPKVLPREALVDDAGSITLEEDFSTRLAAAEDGDTDAAFEVGMALLLCSQQGSAVREAVGEEPPLPALDLSHFHCEDVPTDPALTDRLLRQAADDGHVEAAREYGIAATELTPLDGTEALSQSDVIAIAANEYRALDYLEFAATSGDVDAMKHLAVRLGGGFRLPAGSAGSLELRAGDPGPALAWFYALQIAGDEPWMRTWREDLRGQLNDQEIVEAEAQGQEYYYSYLAAP